jgi:transcriptional regulator with PAS, ATPase and Fis domain
MKKIDSYIDNRMISILSLLNDGIVITDEKGFVKYINPAYTLYSGKEPEAMLNKHISELRPGAVLPQVLETHKAIRNIPRKVGNVESYCDYMPIMEKEKVIGGLIVVKDVVRIKELIKELEDANKTVAQLNQQIKNSFSAKTTFEDLIGASMGLNEVVKVSRKAAKTDSPVLLIGESGVGKDVVAQSIHNGGPRKEMPFVDINCAALPENLLESELFGYSEGAFTGAKKGGKLGLFELANGGTLFLDEITELPLSLQAKLLRAIQEKKIMKLGGETTKQLDVRIIAATNKNILDCINKKQFREDLYFRLAVFVIEIPPLRKRKKDIHLFINNFINEQEKKKQKPINISEEAMAILMDYDWPGNVRELRNAIEYSCNTIEGNVIEVSNLPPNILKKGTLLMTTDLAQKELSLSEIIENAEKQAIKFYLQLYGSNMKSKEKIAEVLNVSIATLYNKIKKYGLG